MCGICGIVSFKNAKPISNENLRNMSNVMFHRGPDDSGTFLNKEKSVGFGFRRLSIIDIEGGHQPMTNNDNTIWLVFNGEIYNHVSLRQRLINQGYHFKTNSDSETLIHGYAEWGEDLLNEIRGMFSFAIWDKNKQSLMLARDRLGIKPLYYHLDNNSFSFASEIKALLSLQHIEARLNEKSLYNYLSFAVTPSPLTMFDNIKKLEPGHTLIVKKNGRIKETRYWEPISHKSTIKSMSEKDIVIHLRKLLRQSVKFRMMSDVPYGVFLSGGLDSSLNVGLMNELIDGKVNTFSVSIEDDLASNELSHAKMVSDYFNTNHFELSINHKDCIEFLPDMVKYQDEPLCDPVCLPIYFVSQLARKNGIYVIQVGEGADELFSGYTMYNMFNDINKRYFEPFSNLPFQLKKQISRLLKLFISQKKYKYLDRAVNDRHLFWGGATPFDEFEILKLFRNNPEEDNYNSQIEPIYSYFQEKMPNNSFIDQITYLELRHRLPELLLMRVDKMAMATSVETRVPFLDHELVEFALSIPDTLKYKNGIGKYILKEAARGIVPEFVIDRRKMGFCGSASNMMSGRLLEFAKNEILDSDIINNKFNMDYVSSIIKSHESNKIDHGMKIFSLLNLSLWSEHWIN